MCKNTYMLEKTTAFFRKAPCNSIKALALRFYALEIHITD